VIRFTLRLLYPREKRPRYKWSGRLDELEGGFGHFGKIKDLVPAGDSN
jgi:hypothetical protein